MREIQDDKSIIHPKKQIADPQQFIRDFLQNDILDKCIEVPGSISEYKNSIEFQLSHFEDFFMTSSEDKFQIRSKPIVESDSTADEFEEKAE